MELYESITDLVWDYQVFKSMARHYQRQRKISREEAENYVRNNCLDDMRKYYERLYLPQVNLELEYAK